MFAGYTSILVSGGGWIVSKTLILSFNNNNFPSLKPHDTHVNVYV